MSGARAFQLIGEEEVSPPHQDTTANANAQVLLLALKAVSQRAMTAITNLFTLGLVFSVWWLCREVLTEPTTLRLIAVGGYALFCLSIDIVRRK